MTAVSGSQIGEENADIVKGSRQLYGNCVCLSVWLFGIFVPPENFSLTWRRHQYRWRIFKFWHTLCTHGHWAVRVPSVSNLLWHPLNIVISQDTHTVAERLKWSWNYLFLRLRSVTAGIRTQIFCMPDERFNWLHHRRSAANGEEAKVKRIFKKIMEHRWKC